MPDRRALLVLLVAFVLLHGGALLLLDRAPIGDEAHFIPTIQRFVQQPTLETLRTYNEMSGPLPFAVYAAWGSLFGFEPIALRICSLLIAALSYLAIYHFLSSDWSLQRPVLFSTIMLNPYMIALSVLVYTDMPAIGLGAFYCWAFLKRKPAVAFIALAAALLCRQHAACFLIAGLIAARSDRRMLIATAAAALPLIALMFFWQGAAPDNPARDRFVSGLAWHPASLVLYVAALAIYLAPLVVMRMKTIYRPRRIAWGIAMAVVLYPFFPVRPSDAAQSYGAQRVGFVDWGAQWLSPDFPLNDLIFAVAFAAGAPIVLTLIAERRRNTRLLDAVVLSFLAMMPMAYIHWEKYLTLILPAAAMRVYLIDRQQPA